MPIVTDRFAFYHCPRTAGSWVRSVLLAQDIPHWTVGYAHDIPAECPVGKLSFTVWRNPHEWLLSWRRLVESKPDWAWSVPDWMLNAKTVDDANGVMRRYKNGCDVVLDMDDLREGLQGVFLMAGMHQTVPDLPPTKDHAVYPTGYKHWSQA